MKHQRGNILPAVLGGLALLAILIVGIWVATSLVVLNLVVWLNVT